jgi:hypothetical protein
MPQLNIIPLNSGDNQEDVVNKINSNFDSIVSNGGGPQGDPGAQGEQGPIGPAGPKGDPGQQGTRGSRWFVQPSQPIGGTTDPILNGDYWVNTFLQNSIFVFGSSGWTDTGDNLSSTELFKTLIGVSGPIGASPLYNAVVLNTSFPELNTFVLSDSVSLAPTANPTYAKFLIATNSTSDYPILEFAKTNASGVGTPLDYNRHPQFRWLSTSGTNYNLLFSVPQDEFKIVSGGSLQLRSTASNLILSGSNGVTLESGTSMNFTSTSGFNINAGTGVLSITSLRFNLNSSSFSTTIPISISSNVPGYAMSFFNSNTSGAGISFQTSSTSSSVFLANFVSGGISRFNIRADGRVYARQTASAITTNTSASTVTLTVSAKTVYTWSVNTNSVPNGNTVIMSIPNTNFRGISFPVGSNTGIGSWTNYLGNNESITLKIFSSTSSNKIQFIGYNTAATSISYTMTELGTAAQSVEVTIMRLSSSTSYKIYYQTCEGECGVLV